MSQQINLLNPALIKQKDFLNLNNIGIILGMLSMLMVAYYGYAQRELSLLTTQRNQVALELTATQATLKQTAQMHAPREQNQALQGQIQQLKHKEKMQQQILQTIEQSSATPESGYAALMRAFAKQKVEGLWLTSFSIDSQTEKLNIHGKTLQADLVPEYITRLGDEPALQGKSFSALNMNLPKLDAIPANASAPTAAATPGVNSKNTSKQAAEASYIEFSLQSIDDKLMVESLSTPNAPADGGKS